MKYRFYTVLHNMKLDQKRNKGQRIRMGEYNARITNSSAEFDTILNNVETSERIGYHSEIEFTHPGSTYLYIDGELEGIDSWAEMDLKGLEFTFDLLRQAQYLTHYFWAVQDNNIYVRDGFLIAYQEDFSDVATYKASLSLIPSTANVDQTFLSTFSAQDIISAISLNEQGLFEFNLDIDRKDFEEYNGSRYPSSEVFYKGKGSTRYVRAFFFSIAARSQAIIPLKITSYVNALECLFSTANTELTYRIAERVALLLEEKKEDRLILFNQIKKAYAFRSKIVHGDYLKLRNSDEQELVEISTMLDDVIRLLLTTYKEFFDEESNEKLESKFLYLTFEDNKIN